MKEIPKDWKDILYDSFKDKKDSFKGKDTTILKEKDSDRKDKN